MILTYESAFGRPPLHAPGLRVGREGEVAVTASGDFHWIVHRRPPPVAFLVSSLAGLGGGETLDARVTVAPGASATVTGQGPTALLETETPATHRWTLDIAEGAHLTYLPWVTIPFPGARSQSELLVRLAPEASLVAWETLSIGRVAAGERFRFHELRSTWRILGPDGPVLHERLAVRGSDRPQAEAMLGGMTHLGCLFVVGPEDELLPVAAVRRLLAGRAEVTGASRPAPSLLVVRALDRGAERLERAFWPVVNAAREAAGLPRLAPGDVARRWFDLNLRSAI